VLTDLIAAMGGAVSYSMASDAFAALAADRAEFAGMSYDTLGLKGVPVASARGATAGAPA
jgi:NADH-quinone oxidoreductase subunit G